VLIKHCIRGLSSAFFLASLLATVGSSDAAVSSLYKAGYGTIRTISPTLLQISDLKLNLPAATPEFNFAIVTLNVPNVSSLNGFCGFAVVSGGKQYSAANYVTTGGTTLVTGVPLASASQLLQGEFELQGLADTKSYCEINTYYSLSVILTQN
jgi:hypothetical protein